MGKVRRLRKKYHLACQKSETESASPTVAPVSQYIPGQVEVPVLGSQVNIFKDLVIPLSDLKQSLHPSPSVPVLGSVSDVSVTARGGTGKITEHVSKKDKRLARREALLLRIDTVEKLRKKTKRKSKSGKTSDAPKPDLPSRTVPLPSNSTSKEGDNPSVFNIKTLPTMELESLMDALPAVPTGLKGRNPTRTSKTGDEISEVKAWLPKKKRQRQFLHHQRLYKLISSDTLFKANPASAISNYLQRMAPRNSYSPSKLGLTHRINKGKKDCRLCM